MGYAMYENNFAMAFFVMSAHSLATETGVLAFEDIRNVWKSEIAPQ